VALLISRTGSTPATAPGRLNVLPRARVRFTISFMDDEGASDE